LSSPDKLSPLFLFLFSVSLGQLPEIKGETRGKTSLFFAFHSLTENRPTS